MSPFLHTHKLEKVAGESESPQESKCFCLLTQERRRRLQSRWSMNFQRPSGRSGITKQSSDPTFWVSGHVAFVILFDLRGDSHFSPVLVRKIPTKHANRPFRRENKLTGSQQGGGGGMGIKKGTWCNEHPRELKLKIFNKLFVVAKEKNRTNHAKHLA